MAHIAETASVAHSVHEKGKDHSFTILTVSRADVFYITAIPLCLIKDVKGMENELFYMILLFIHVIHKPYTNRKRTCSHLATLS